MRTVMPNQCHVHAFCHVDIMHFFINWFICSTWCSCHAPSVCTRLDIFLKSLEIKWKTKYSCYNLELQHLCKYYTHWLDLKCVRNSYRTIPYPETSEYTLMSNFQRDSLDKVLPPLVSVPWMKDGRRCSGVTVIKVLLQVAQLIRTLLAAGIWKCVIPLWPCSQRLQFVKGQYVQKALQCICITFRKLCWSL